MLQLDREAIPLRVEVQDQKVGSSTLVALAVCVNALGTRVLQLAHSHGQEGMREEAANKADGLVMKLGLVPEAERRALLHQQVLAQLGQYLLAHPSLEGSRGLQL